MTPGISIFGNELTLRDRRERIASRLRELGQDAEIVKGGYLIHREGNIPKKTYLTFRATRQWERRLGLEAQ